MARYPLTKVLQVMKPSKPSIDVPSHQVKLDAALEDESDYIAEEKFDGCRYLYIGGRFFSTHIQVEGGVSTGFPVEKTAQLRPLVEELKPIHERYPKIILDGEIIVRGGKAQDVVSIVGCAPEEAVARQRTTKLQYMVFDILRLEDWLQNWPWWERHACLESLSAMIEETLSIHIVPTVRTSKRKFLDDMLAEGHEGIVLKHVEGKYHFGKRPAWNWIKVKTEIEDDVVIIGFEPAEVEYKGKDSFNWPYRDADGNPITRLAYFNWIGAIVYGKYKYPGGPLVRIGTCSGMTDEQRERMSDQPELYIGQVMKLTAMEITRDGAYRHPRFVMIHPDKNPAECLL